MNIERFNLADYKSGVTNTKKSNGEYPQRVTPGAYVCTVTGFKNSTEIENYGGSPFIEFYMLTECGKLATARFWVIKETDSPKSKDWKRKQLKDFLMNCGVKDFSSDLNACKESVNKRIQCAFVSEEYVGRDKESGTPIKRTAVKYLWSSAMGKKITYDSKYNKTLSEEDAQLVNGIEKLNKAFDVEVDTSVVSQSHDDADLPF